MTALPRPAPTAAAAVSRSARDRIRGIDAARALAILGMVMVHFGPFEPDTTTLVGRLYRFSHGRASVLFVLLAGVGVSLLFAARPGAVGWARVAWRAIVFYPVGVALQALPTPVAVILQFYAAYYLVAAVAAMLPTRALAVLTGLWTVAGPLVFLVLADPDLGGRGTATTVSDPSQVLADLVLTGYYPLLTWTPPLLVGVLLGRADLRHTATAVRLTIAGAVTATIAYGSAELAGAALPDGVAGSSFLLADGHTGAPLNVLGATGLAVAVLGLSLLACGAARRLMWPLVAVGQMALTVYVGHLLLLAVAPTLLEARGDVVEAWIKVGRFFLVTTVLCVAWRAVWRRGPLEWLLALPFATRPSAAAQRSPDRAGQDGTEDLLWHQPARDRPTPDRPTRGDPAATGRPAGHAVRSGPARPGTSSMPPPRPSPPSTPPSTSPPGTPPPSS